MYPMPTDPPAGTWFGAGGYRESASRGGFLLLELCSAPATHSF